MDLILADPKAHAKEGTCLAALAETTLTVLVAFSDPTAEEEYEEVHHFAYEE